MFALYKYHQDFGRMGSLDGVFIASKQLVAEFIDMKVNVWRYDVLGKHSEINITVSEDTISLVSDNQEVMDVLTSLDVDISSGIDPIDMYMNDIIDNASYDDGYKSILEGLKAKGLYNDESN